MSNLTLGITKPDTVSKGTHEKLLTEFWRTAFGFAR